MVSLLHLAEITEEGVTFQSPVDGRSMLLTPEHSIQIQNKLGADIMMALDDVVSSVNVDASRFREATSRTTRWIDRCIAAHSKPDTQNLFAIVQVCYMLEPGVCHTCLLQYGQLHQLQAVQSCKLLQIRRFSYALLALPAVDTLLNCALQACARQLADTKACRAAWTVSCARRACASSCSATCLATPLVASPAARTKAPSGASLRSARQRYRAPSRATSWAWGTLWTSWFAWRWVQTCSTRCTRRARRALA